MITIPCTSSHEQTAPLTVELTNYQWTCLIKPRVTANLLMNDMGLQVKFVVEESEPLTTVLSQQEPMRLVCQDSAVELFLAFPDSPVKVDQSTHLDPCSQQHQTNAELQLQSQTIPTTTQTTTTFQPKIEQCFYTNIEINSLGICYAEYGCSRQNRATYSLEQVAALQIKTHRETNAWTCEFVVPRSLIQELVHFDGFTGVFALNLYKISESKEFEHYVSFTPIQVEQPNFHLPEFFALAKCSQGS